MSEPESLPPPVFLDLVSQSGPSIVGAVSQYSDARIVESTPYTLPQIAGSEGDTLVVQGGNLIYGPSGSSPNFKESFTATSLSQGNSAANKNYTFPIYAPPPNGIISKEDVIVDLPAAISVAFSVQLDRGPFIEFSIAIPAGTYTPDELCDLLGTGILDFAADANATLRAIFQYSAGKYTISAAFEQILNLTWLQAAPSNGNDIFGLTSALILESPNLTQTAPSPGLVSAPDALVWRKYDRTKIKNGAASAECFRNYIVLQNPTTALALGESTITAQMGSTLLSMYGNDQGNGFALQTANTQRINVLDTVMTLSSQSRSSEIIMQDDFSKLSSGRSVLNLASASDGDSDATTTYLRAANSSINTTMSVIPTALKISQTSGDRLVLSDTTASILSPSTASRVQISDSILSLAVGGTPREIIDTVHTFYDLSGVARLTIDSSGVKAGNVLLPSESGLIGQYLTSDGMGRTYWSTPASMSALTSSASASAASASPASPASPAAASTSASLASLAASASLASLAASASLASLAASAASASASASAAASAAASASAASSASALTALASSSAPSSASSASSAPASMSALFNPPAIPFDSNLLPDLPVLPVISQIRSEDLRLNMKFDHSIICEVDAVQRMNINTLCSVISTGKNRLYISEDSLCAFVEQTPILFANGTKTALYSPDGSHNISLDNGGISIDKLYTLPTTSGNTGDILTRTADGSEWRKSDFCRSQFSQTKPYTVINTPDETTVIGEGVGRLEIPANLSDGAAFRYSTGGLLHTSETKIRVRIHGTNVWLGVSIPLVAASSSWNAEIMFIYADSNITTVFSFFYDIQSFTTQNTTAIDISTPHPINITVSDADESYITSNYGVLTQIY